MLLPVTDIALDKFMFLSRSHCSPEINGKDARSSMGPAQRSMSELITARLLEKLPTK
jgi:hypothetical protein